MAGPSEPRNIPAVSHARSQMDPLCRLLFGGSLAHFTIYEIFTSILIFGPDRPFFLRFRFFSSSLSSDAVSESDSPPASLRALRASSFAILADLLCAATSRAFSASSSEDLLLARASSAAATSAFAARTASNGSLSIALHSGLCTHGRGRLIVGEHV